MSNTNNYYSFCRIIFLQKFWCEIHRIRAPTVSNYPENINKMTSVDLQLLENIDTVVPPFNGVP